MRGVPSFNVKSNAIAVPTAKGSLVRTNTSSGPRSPPYRSMNRSSVSLLNRIFRVMTSSVLDASVISVFPKPGTKVRYTPGPTSFQSILCGARSLLSPRAFPRTCAGRRVRFAGVGFVVVALSGGAPRIGVAATPAPLRVAHAAVASDHAAASAAGVEVLRAGGNAVDAACATALALGVVGPHASGIGGGGFAVVYLAKTKAVHVLDFREQAPALAQPNLYFRDGKLDRALSRRGGLAVGIPGEVRGLDVLVRRYGRRPFAACVRPAERLASQGFSAGPRLVKAVTEGSAVDALDEVKTVTGFVPQVMSYTPPLRVGDLVKRPALAATLGTLRKRGADIFYKGAIADQIVAAVKAAGGVITREDLAGYRVLERTPIEINYRGQRVVSMPPPSSGGIVIAEVLGILGHRLSDPSKFAAKTARGSSDYLHVFIEALKHGFADRARLLGDTDFVKVPLDQLLSRDYHRSLAARIDDRTVAPIASYGMGPATPSPPKDGGTAHLSVIDAEGNAVALTSTVNTWFGAYLAAGKTGIVLNNQMDDFSFAPGVANAFGLQGTAQNAIAPGKRPLSSMSPTLVIDDGGVRVALGGAGGPTIISGTLQVLLNVLDGKMDAQAASAAPRVHHQWQPDTLVGEPEIPLDVLEGLTRRGHKLGQIGTVGLVVSMVNVIIRTQDGLEAAAEFRSGGAPAGY
jgi:gamma-glutamyltranspeptidase/glutathione hydrolase